MNDTPSETFRKRFKTRRERRGMSQRQLVERLAELGYRMNQPAITRIERGDRKVTLDDAVALAAAIEVPVERLYRRGDSWEDLLVRRAERERPDPNEPMGEDDSGA